MSFEKITEGLSPYHDLEQMSTLQLLENMNREDQSVPLAVKKAIPQIESLINVVVVRLSSGGRLFYTGSGTSGRLGVLDASECPPTYGVPPDMVTGIIAGGDAALRRSVEEAEDKEAQGWQDLLNYKITGKDVVIGIAASGATPYVIGALTAARQHGITTGCIVCNPGSPVAALSDYPAEIIVGPELVSGSTRMKSGTAQKLVLNMISTATMIRLGYVEDNLMTNMKISNEKLTDRAVRIIMKKTGMGDYTLAKSFLSAAGSIAGALEKIRNTSF